ncbi:MAG: hypothetical protein OEW15_01530 [Nitrospirota bacterium]|nr:hypothetical protein [Nitrospirota bacterium]
MKRAFWYAILHLTLAVTVVMPAAAAPKQAPARPVKTKRLVKANKTVTPLLNVQGFRPGMRMAEVRQLLRKKGVSEYTTAYADLFVYSPAPNTEMRLRFTCGAKGWVLGSGELETVFSREESAIAVPRYRDMLLAKYGTPVLPSPSPDRIDLCWGACLSGAKGVRAVAATSDAPDGLVRLRLTVENAALVQSCQGDRERKIGRWLSRWTRDIAKFQLGMSLREASKLYQKRYGDPLLVAREKDESGGRKVVTILATNEHDFFAGLDADSLLFEGKGPGRIHLKFTGSEAEFATGLNQRLFAASFTTTDFTDEHRFSDLDAKLDIFIKAYGKPSDVIRLTGLITATWQGGGKQRTLSIADSGMISIEQFDGVLLETYRDAAVQRQQGDAGTKFDRNIF